MNLAIVMVAHDEGDSLVPGLDELGRQRRDGDEIVVVHNTSDAEGVARTAEVARTHPACRLIETGGNRGFGHAANLGAAQTTAETIVVLNPDTVPEPGFMDAMREPPDAWDAWQALVTMADGERVNTAGNVPHYLGFGWVGEYLEPVASIDPEPHEVGFLSGAAFAIRRPVFEELGGFPELFFVYVEDTDLSHRLRLTGRRFGVLPAARLRHGYEFGGREFKMFELEKNRWLMIIRCYPGPLLWLVIPALILLEPITLAIAQRQGWSRAKLRASRGVLRDLPQALRERREVQAQVRIGAAEFARALASDIDSPLFGPIGHSLFVRTLLRLYWLGVRIALGVPRQRPRARIARTHA